MFSVPVVLLRKSEAAGTATSVANVFLNQNAHLRPIKENIFLVRLWRISKRKPLMGIAFNYEL